MPDFIELTTAKGLRRFIRMEHVSFIEIDTTHTDIHFAGTSAPLRLVDQATRDQLMEHIEKPIKGPKTRTSFSSEQTEQRTKRGG